MLRRLSLRTRVLAGLALVLVGFGVVAVIVTSTTRDHLIDQIDDRLASAERRVSEYEGAGPDDHGDADDPGPGPSDEPYGDRLSDVYEGVLDTDGNLTTIYEPNLRDGDAAVPDIELDEAAAAAAANEHFTTGAVGDDDLRYRVCAFPGPDGTVLVTALPLTDVDDAISRLVTMEIVAGAFILAVLAAVAWWVVRLGIRPIKQMTRTAEDIAGGDLSQRVPEAPSSTEAGRLGLALNHMLEQLDVAFAAKAESEDRLRRFVSDASHELRTPVATIRGYVELYRSGGLSGPGELDEAMRRAEQEAVRMGRLVDDLLSLAKIDEGRHLELRPVDLTKLAADAARDAAAVDPARSISAELDGPVVVEGDEDRLRQVIANVVANALVHTPAATPIELRVSRNGTEASIAVTDHGHGMTRDVAARVTQRFYRADPARARDRGGSGLGMSIADAAVSAHGGDIAVASEIGRGTTVTVTLPLAAATPD